MTLNITRINTVLFFFSTIFVKIRFLVQPIIFIATPVYAPKRKYCMAKKNSFAVLKISSFLCSLH